MVSKDDNKLFILWKHIQILHIFKIVGKEEISLYDGIGQYFLIYIRIQQWRNAGLKFAQNNYPCNILLLYVHGS